MKTKSLLFILTAFCIYFFNAITVNAQYAQWTYQSSGTGNNLRSVYFIDASVGYVVGDYGTILKTSNGGASWVKQVSPIVVPFPDDLTAVYFTDANTGYIVGIRSTILKTINGGSSWIKVESGITGESFNSIFFITDQIGYIVGSNGLILKTIDAGVSWKKQNALAKKFSSVYFTDVNTGYVVGQQGTILKTTDGGINWIQQTIGTTGYFLTSVFFTNSDIGYVTGTAGAIFKTINGGKEWFPQLSGKDNTYGSQSVWFIDDNIGYTVGERGSINKTTNGGGYWDSPYFLGVNGYLNSIFFADKNTGYIVGDNGVILKTTTRGWCTGKPGQPVGETNFCKATGISTQYTTSGAEYATSYSWSLNPSSAGSITGSGTTSTVIWNGTYNGIVKVWVQAIGACNGEYSSLDVFINNSNPQVFSLSKPDNGTWTSTTPMFQWNSTSSYLRYNLFIDGVLKKANITGSSYQILPDEAIGGGMHTWYVIANNGCTIQSGETWSFRVDATPPNVFNITSPIDDSWSNNTLPIFSWDASSDAGSGLLKYQLWIDGELNRDVPTSELSTTPNYDLTNGNHTWMIVAIDNNGNIRNSTQTWKIKIDNLPPEIGSVRKPSNNQYLSAIYPVLSWGTSYDAGIGFQKFQLFIDGIMIKDNLINSSWTITDPLKYGVHNWYVKRFDSLGNNASLTTYSFYIDNAKPNSFSLITPGNKEIVNLPTPNFKWQPVSDSIGGSGISKYELLINNVVNRDSIPYSQTTVAPKNALNQGVYSWFINAYDKVGNVRQSSQTNTFYIDWEAPADFILLEPNDNTTISVSKPTFKWNASSDIGSGLEKYELCISGQLPIPVLPSENFKLLPIDLTNGKYTWYVKAYDVAGTFTSSNIFNLTINALPGQTGLPIGLTELCVNATNTDYTTTQISNVSSYIWEISPLGAGVIIGNGLTANIDWNNTFTGTVQISVKGHNSNGDGASSSLAITVNSLPASAGTISGISNICQGQNSVTYTVPAIDNATSYIWTLPTGATGTSTTNSITTNYSISAVSGNITVKGHNDCGDGNVSTLAITVNPLPVNAGVISGISSVCQGQNSVTYTVPAIDNATSYIWTLPTGAIGTSTTNSINVSFGISAVSGNITVKGKNSCGDGDSFIFPIVVNTKPTTPIVTLIANGLHSDAITGNQWYSKDGLIVGATSQDYSPKSSGDYYVIVSANGCSSNPSNSMNFIPTGIDPIETNKSIKVYPNPVTNELVIEMIGNTNSTDFDVLNSIGQVVFSGSMFEKTIIQTASFTPGAYFVKLKSGKTFEFKKVIKK